MLHPNWRDSRRAAGRGATGGAEHVLLQATQSRGQAFHQDNFYLRVKPGTCVAAWVAVDDADEENGSISACQTRRIIRFNARSNLTWRNPSRPSE